MTDSTQAAFVAAITNEGGEFVLMLAEARDQGERPHCQRWKLTESLARKLRRELNERLD